MRLLRSADVGHLSALLTEAYTPDTALSTNPGLSVNREFCPKSLSPAAAPSHLFSESAPMRQRSGLRFPLMVGIKILIYVSSHFYPPSFFCAPTNRRIRSTVRALPKVTTLSTSGGVTI
jgi:hypothetical protein